jgi:phage shock protein A
MTNIFVRITDIISANINDMIDRVEDPERMIKQIIREMEENIRRAKDGVIDAIASEKQLAKELEFHQKQAHEWGVKAEGALKADKEDLARKALARRKEHDNIAKDMEAAHDAARKTSENLKSQLRALENRLDEAKRKQSTLKARQRAAQARQDMGKTINLFQRGLDAQDKFARMEDRVLEIEARSEAIAELDDEKSDLEKEFDKLEIETDVEIELEELKKKMR